MNKTIKFEVTVDIEETDDLGVAVAKAMNDFLLFSVTNNLGRKGQFSSDRGSVRWEAIDRIIQRTA